MMTNFKGQMTLKRVMKTMPELIYLSEPQLEFGGGQKTEDPRDGLALFGPFQPLPNRQIQVGVIGTPTGIKLYESFVQAMSRPQLSKKIQRPSFPGFEAVFGVTWPIKPALAYALDPDALTKALAKESLKERTDATVSLYLNEIRRIGNEEEISLDLWYIVVPTEVKRRCRVLASDKIDKTTQTYLKKFASGQGSIFRDSDEALGAIYDQHSDFHHQLKARILKEGIKTPSQLILEPKLTFRDEYRGWEFKDEMKAHLAWTLSTTAYYKLGRLPWKLSDIREGVCYLGLVFKKVDSLNRKGFACSAAQMFLDSGDGTVFKGNIGPWESATQDEFHLDKASAKELVRMALESYRDKRDGNFPKEVFIHGRAGFAVKEWEGFTEVVNELCPDTKLTGIVIRESSKLKLFRDVAEEECRYGNLRGLAYILNDHDGYLWTRGFVPRMNTSMSMEIPNPLRVRIDRSTNSDVSMEQVLKDILALSKLNYNACVFGDGLPVTLRFSDLIGSILTAVDGMNQRVLPFKYYI